LPLSAKAEAGKMAEDGTAARSIDNVLQVEANGEGTVKIYFSDSTTGSYKEGDVIDIRAYPDTGYYFDGWTTSNGGMFSDASLATTKFTMPAGDTTLTAAFKKYGAKEENSFMELNGVMWFYNTWFGNKFTDIKDDLDNLQNNGINILAFFCPYYGNKELYDGCDPMDWFDVSPQCGTMDDFRELVSAAHDRGMKVIGYFVNIYIDKESEFFKKAEEQYAAGDYYAPECATFHWTDDPTEPLPVNREDVFGGRAGSKYANRWEWSETAGAYYCNVWLGGGLDFRLPGAHATSYEIEKFWLDAGMDGFMFDVARTMPKMHDLWIRYPEKYTSNDKWLSVEISDSTMAKEYAEYGFNCWFNYADSDVANDYTRVVGNITAPVINESTNEIEREEVEVDRINADGLEEAFKNSDYAHSMNCWTYAWSPWGDEAEVNLIPREYPTYTNDDVMRVQEAALLAGGGITYGGGMYDQYLTWSDTLKTNWGRVLKTVNDNAALLPSASRTRLATKSNETSYAMTRTSKDGSQTALLVYNLSDKEQTVTVDLKDSKIAAGKVLKDLYNGGTAGEVTGSTWQVSLPAYGFQMLSVTDKSVIDPPKETVKLSPPQSVKAVQRSAGQAKITWKAVTGAKKYEIYRSTKALAGFSKIGTASAASYTDKKAGAGKTWYYKILAVGASADENSSLSNAAKVSMMKAPAIKKLVSVKKGEIKVTLKQKVSGAKGYKIYAASKKGGKFKEAYTMKKVSSIKGSVKKLKSGKTYFIKVRAYKKVNGKMVYGKYSKAKQIKVK